MSKPELSLIFVELLTRERGRGNGWSCPPWVRVRAKEGQGTLVAWGRGNWTNWASLAFLSS